MTTQYIFSIFLLLALSASGQTCRYSVSFSTSFASMTTFNRGAIQIAPSSPSCSWNAQPNASWIQLAAPTAGRGTGNVGFSLTPNPSETVARSARIQVADQFVTVIQPPSVPESRPPSGGGGGLGFRVQNAVGPLLRCSPSYALTGFLNSTAPGQGGTGTFTSVFTDDCAWTVTPTDSFVQVTAPPSPDLKTGQRAAVSVAANPSSQSRTSRIVVTIKDNGAGASARLEYGEYEIRQEPAPQCVLSIASLDLQLPATGDSRNLQLTTNNSSCAWQIQSSAPWLQATASTGTGSASVRIQAEQNNIANSRNATLTIRDPNGVAAPVTVNVWQGGATCTITLSPTSWTAPAEGGSVAFDLRVPQGCPWSLDSSSFLRVASARSGTGPSRVSVEALENQSSASRQGTVLIHNAVFQVTQGGRGCSLTASLQSTAFPPEGGQTKLSISPSAVDCPWQIRSDANWLRVTRPSGTGPSVVDLEIPPNATTQLRTANISIGNQSLSLSQAPASSVNTTTQATPATLEAEPPVVTACNRDGLGRTTLRWTSDGARELRVNAPTGDLLANVDRNGFYETGDWVTHGMTFYLIGANATVLAQNTVAVQCESGPVASLKGRIIRSPRSAQSGTALNDVVAETVNTGNRATGPSWAGYYFSRTPQVDRTGIFSGTRCGNGGLNSGATMPCGGRVAVPADLTPGIWYLGLVPDHDEQLPDMAERAAESFGPIQVFAGDDSTSTNQLPESPHPYPYDFDKTWVYRYADINTPALDVTFSPETNVEAGQDFIWVLDSRGQHVGGSPFTGTQLAGRTITVPGSVVQIRLIADIAIQAYGLKVTRIAPRGQFPRLAITSLVSAPFGTAGGTLNLNMTLTNPSSTDAPGPFRVGFYFSDSPQTENVFTEITCDYPSGLKAGASHTCGGDARVPLRMPPGIYYLIAIADDERKLTLQNREEARRVSDSGQVAIRSN